MQAKMISPETDERIQRTKRGWIGGWGFGPTRRLAGKMMNAPEAKPWADRWTGRRSGTREPMGRGKYTIEVQERTES